MWIKLSEKRWLNAFCSLFVLVSPLVLSVSLKLLFFFSTCLIFHICFCALFFSFCINFFLFTLHRWQRSSTLLWTWIQRSFPAHLHSAQTCQTNFLRVWSAGSFGTQEVLQPQKGTHDPLSSHLTQISQVSPDEVHLVKIQFTILPVWKHQNHKRIVSHEIAGQKYLFLAIFPQSRWGKQRPTEDDDAGEMTPSSLAGMQRFPNYAGDGNTAAGLLCMCMPSNHTQNQQQNASNVNLRTDLHTSGHNFTSRTLIWRCATFWTFIQAMYHSHFYNFIRLEVQHHELKHDSRLTHRNASAVSWNFCPNITGERILNTRHVK